MCHIVPLDGISTYVHNHGLLLPLGIVLFSYMNSLDIRYSVGVLLSISECQLYLQEYNSITD